MGWMMIFTKLFSNGCLGESHSIGRRPTRTGMDIFEIGILRLLFVLLTNFIKVLSSHQSETQSRDYARKLSVILCSSLSSSYIAPCCVTVRSDLLHVAVIARHSDCAGQAQLCLLSNRTALGK